MIRHVVLWTIKDEYEGKNKDELALTIQQELIKLKTEIPEIIEITVGINIPNPYSNYDVILDCLFNSLDDLITYQNHPKHKEIATFIGNIRIERACIDYYI